MECYLSAVPFFASWDEMTEFRRGLTDSGQSPVEYRLSRREKRVAKRLVRGEYFYQLKRAFKRDRKMKKYILIFALFLSACGPREIGGGRSSEPVDYGGASASDAMRYPMTGANRSEKMLYYYNKPEVMERVQEASRDHYLRRMGVSPEDPAYREIPKQKSPFRQ